MTLPNTFVNGELTDADDVNENFTFLDDRGIYQEVKGTSAISNSSGSYQDIADMSITITKDGNYLINFQISPRIGTGTSGNVSGRFRILKNGSLEGVESILQIQAATGLGALSLTSPISINMIVENLIIDDIIKVQWRDVAGDLYAEDNINGGGRLLSVIRLN